MVRPMTLRSQMNARSVKAPDTARGSAVAGWTDRFGARVWAVFQIEDKLVVAGTLALATVLILLGITLERIARHGLAQKESEAHMHHVEDFIAPHVQSLADGDTLSEENHATLLRLVEDTSLGRNLALLQIYNRPGDLVFSTGWTDRDAGLDRSLAKRVAERHVVIADGTFGKPAAPAGVGQKRSMIEMHVPVFRAKTDEVIAIVRLHEHDVHLLGQLQRERHRIWLCIFGVFVLLFGTMLMAFRLVGDIVRSKENLLEQNARRAGELARRIDALRHEANRCRVNVVRSNEAYLAHVSADLHDGPVQALSLMALKLPALDGEERATAGAAGRARGVRGELEPLIQQALNDLRNMSAGLALPEIDGLTLAETIHLAIDRHELITGTAVTRQIDCGDAQAARPVRVCAYRVVQEALTNCFKHAGGIDQQVRCEITSDEKLRIEVANGQHGPPTRCVDVKTRARLGMKGMEIRVRSLHGCMSIGRLANGGTAVRVRLPLRV